jgi:formylglycine-generating enzyme required for sulfatase activity
MELAFWNSIQNRQSAADFAEYLRKYPQGEFVVPAKSKLAELQAGELATVELAFWNSIKDSQDAAVFEDYLRKYPHGKFVMPAKDKLESAFWNRIKDSDKPADFKNYLTKYPKGKFVKTANSKLAQLQAPAYPFGIEMVEIPGGTFQIGCGPKDRECDDDEKPRHPVTVSAFALGKTEVTQRQWKAVMGSNPSEFKPCGDDCPVERVSWNDAQAFIAKLNEQTQHRYGFRLPSEAEWEYACRAGQKSLYCGGDDLDALAWYDNNSGNTTHPVGRKRANAWGLNDMSGNVHEWTCSAYADHYGSGQETDCPAAAQYRVLRGGSWIGFGRFARSASRFVYEPDARGSNTGVRLALGPQSQAGQ